eukprot:CAMPEP_0204044558 /NCGR_PEP_ID=MMETSP0360-20130528/105393_1 /ASSEMBLY_ACC=CAM_ASM_000342 /TAXON_ID=268821 /ORGANISM="Scrippsiella Hangoei, Strain SHTV-5" /LENGTH=72 /DNA_ID=CAMNT_0050991025 /DNA_START=72 /DNA_END=286 /DNA_ORIENTATION=-
MTSDDDRPTAVRVGDLIPVAVLNDADRIRTDHPRLHGPLAALLDQALKELGAGVQVEGDQLRQISPPNGWRA